MTKQFSINHDANVFNVLLVCVFLKILLFFASCFCFFTADDIVSRLAQYIRKRSFFCFSFSRHVSHFTDLSQYSCRYVEKTSAIHSEETAAYRPNDKDITTEPIGITWKLMARTGNRRGYKSILVCFLHFRKNEEYFPPFSTV